jgi:hypothetical protein
MAIFGVIKTVFIIWQDRIERGESLDYREDV